jgi:hypothetical protein
MDCVEASSDLEAGGYPRPLYYTVDESLGKENGRLRLVLDAGELRCSEPAQQSRRICYLTRETESVIASERPSFVYLDVGAWADDVDGEGTERRDFALVCGQHVYLCEYTGQPSVPVSRVPAVRELFTGMANLGCGARVVKYARARGFARETWQDPDLYLLLGDLHLPPVRWFYTQGDFVSPPERELPAWLASAPAMARQPNRVLRSAYECAAWHEFRGDEPAALAPIGTPDIFRKAGPSLVRFLRAVASLDPQVRKRLHFIQLGDMFELWIGRDYHLVPGSDGMPRWRHADSVNIVADWCLEVMIKNARIFSLLDLLGRAGLAEVKYLGGNHDGYLMMPELAAQLGLPPREPCYRGLHDDLFAEHGHRFDNWNFDNVDGRKLLSGPGVTRPLRYAPFLRQLEGPITDLMFWTPKQRDLHLLGATLHYLYERFDRQQKPFAIYAMGHSHARMLARFDVRAKRTLKDRILH